MSQTYYYGNEYRNMFVDRNQEFIVPLLVVLHIG